MSNALSALRYDLQLANTTLNEFRPNDGVHSCDVMDHNQRVSTRTNDQWSYLGTTVRQVLDVADPDKAAPQVCALSSYVHPAARTELVRSLLLLGLSGFVLIAGSSFILVVTVLPTAGLPLVHPYVTLFFAWALTWTGTSAGMVTLVTLSCVVALAAIVNAIAMYQLCAYLTSPAQYVYAPQSISADARQEQLAAISERKMLRSGSGIHSLSEISSFDPEYAIEIASFLAANLYQRISQKDVSTVPDIKDSIYSWLLSQLAHDDLKNQPHYEHAPALLHGALAALVWIAEHPDQVTDDVARPIMLLFYGGFACPNHATLTRHAALQTAEKSLDHKGQPLRFYQQHRQRMVASQAQATTCPPPPPPASVPTSLPLPSVLQQIETVQDLSQQVIVLFGDQHLRGGSDPVTWWSDLRRHIGEELGFSVTDLALEKLVHEVVPAHKRLGNTAKSHARALRTAKESVLSEYDALISDGFNEATAVKLALQKQITNPSQSSQDLLRSASGMQNPLPSTPGHPNRPNFLQSMLSPSTSGFLKSILSPLRTPWQPPK